MNGRLKMDLNKIMESYDIQIKAYVEKIDLLLDLGKIRERISGDFVADNIMRRLDQVIEIRDNIINFGRKKDEINKIIDNLELEDTG